MPINNLIPGNIRLSKLYPRNLLLSDKMPVTLLKILKKRLVIKTNTTLYIRDYHLIFHWSQGEDWLLMQPISHAFIEVV